MKDNLKYYDSIADKFESWINPFDLDSRLHWFATQLAPHPLDGTLVLDVGCGLGYFSVLATKWGGHPISLDIGTALLKKTKGTLPSPVAGNALQLPFSDNTFQFVISSECIEHTPDPLHAIREMVRVTQPRGFIMLTTPNRAWFWSVPIAKTLGLRNFSGIENWAKRSAVRDTLMDSGTEILVDEGLHLLPFQIRLLWPILNWLNIRGQHLRQLMINQCWVAQKNG